MKRPKRKPKRLTRNELRLRKIELQLFGNSPYAHTGTWPAGTSESEKRKILA